MDRFEKVDKLIIIYYYINSVIQFSLLLTFLEEPMALVVTVMIAYDNLIPLVDLVDLNTQAMNIRETFNNPGAWLADKGESLIEAEKKLEQALKIVRKLNAAIRRTQSE